MPNLDKRFTYHPPTDEKKLKFSSLRECAKDLAQEIINFVPEGRERSLALTKLEECIMWANAGIARNP